MKINVPVQVDVDLDPLQTILFLKKYILHVIKLHKHKHINDWNANYVIKNEKLFCRYQEQGCEYQYEEIKIEDPAVFNLCKAGIELLEAYSEIHAKSKYAYINGVI